MATIHIEGRRWFKGNTYHSVRIWIDGKQVAFLPYAYGYGDGYLQTAAAWLCENGYPGTEGHTLHMRETLGATYSVIDVSRKRDL